MVEYNQFLIDWINMKEEKQYIFIIIEDNIKRFYFGLYFKFISYFYLFVFYFEGDLKKYQVLLLIGLFKETKRKKVSNYD